MSEVSPSPVWTPKRQIIGIAILAIWLAIASLIGITGWLAVDPTDIFPPIALTAIVPVVVFLGLYTFVPGFKAFVLAQDPVTLTLLQTWRVIGFGFLTLYFYDVLPVLFGWVAGVGDVLVGIAAVFVVLKLQRDRAYLTSRDFVNFHILGLLDFVGAVGTAALTGGAIAALVGDGPTSAPMAVWPLNLFPSFGVPLFIILHLTVLFKVMKVRERKGERQPVAVAG